MRIAFAKNGPAYGEGLAGQEPSQHILSKKGSTWTCGVNGRSLRDDLIRGIHKSAATPFHRIPMPVVHGLAEMTQPSAISGLLLLQADDDELVRRSARWALQSLPAKQVGLGLLAALRDAHPVVVRQAVVLCPFYGDASVLEVLDGIDPSPWGPDGASLLAGAKGAIHRRLALRAAAA